MACHGPSRHGGCRCTDSPVMFVCLLACPRARLLVCSLACPIVRAYGLPAVGVGSDGDISRLSSASATAAASWELGSCCGSASSALSAGCRYESALLFRRRSVDTCQRCSSAGPGERDRALRGDWCDYSDQDLCGVGGRRRRGRSALCSLLHLEDVSLGLVGARGLRQQVRLPAMYYQHRYLNDSCMDRLAPAA